MIFHKKKQRNAEEISTASLPDIVFMLLFFFMVTTVMRQENPKVEIEKPSATETEKLDHPEWMAEVFIGRDAFGAWRIQFGEVFTDLEHIGQLIAEKRAMLAESVQGKFTVVLKVDRQAEMGLVTDVKRVLREINALKIQYAALPETEGA